MKELFKKIGFAVYDIISAPLVLLGAYSFRVYRRKGVGNFPLTTRILDAVGVFPLHQHYYDPLIAPQKTIDAGKLAKKRELKIDFRIDEQLALLKTFTFREELLNLETTRVNGLPPFQYDNDSFECGDAEFYYSLVRKIKPKRIIEIGSGNSTKVCLYAIHRNLSENAQSDTDLFCIEPYEAPWLESIGMIHVIRKKVEEIDSAFFKTLEADDILFIDSSHMIRSGGDVLFNLLFLLGGLNPGVYVHIHDIFTPYDYPYEWIQAERRFWNEQYLLEALLIGNPQLEVIGALNYLSHDYGQSLRAVFPMYGKAVGGDLGSFWIRTK